MAAVRCTNCRAEFDVSGLKPGSKFKCGNCKALLSVPMPSPSAERRLLREKGGKAKLRKKGAALPGRKKKGKFPLLPVAMGGGALVLIIILLIVVSSMGRRKSVEDTGSGSTATLPAAGKEKEGGSGTPGEKKGPSIEELRKEYRKRAASALTATEHYNLASWCEQNSLPEEHRKELELCLEADGNPPPGRAGLRKDLLPEVHRLLGHVEFKLDERLKESFAYQYVFNSELDLQIGEWVDQETKKKFDEKTAEILRKEAELQEEFRSNPWLRECIIQENVNLQEAVIKQFHMKTSRHCPYLLFIESVDEKTDEENHSRIGKILTSLYEHFTKKYRDILPKKEGLTLFKFFSFKERDGFEEFFKKHYWESAPKGMRAYYTDKTQDMVSYFGDADLSASFEYHKIFHEGVHQLVHHFKRFAPDNEKERDSKAFWFEEGFAEFVAPSSGKIDEETKEVTYIFEGMYRQRLEEFWAHYQGGREYYFGLEQILRIRNKGQLLTEIHSKFSHLYPEDGEKREEEMTSLYYAQAWFLFYFLNTFDNGKYREKLHRYLEEEFKDKGGGKTLLEIFNLKYFDELKPIEEEYTHYLEELIKG